MNIALVWVHIILVLAFVALVIVQDDARYERIKH
jgi:preprotein translocase subunit SecG